MRNALAPGLRALLIVLSLPMLAFAQDSREEIAPLGQVGAALAEIFGPDAPFDVMVVELPGGTDFMQFSTDLGQITLDFPAYTERQHALAPVAEAFLDARGLRGRWIDLGDGRTLLGEFGDLAEATGHALGFAEAVFDVGPEQTVRFLLIRY
ncbi:hypothetical protein [Oceanibium sediminis]|uniref:hypothetical protein n=1 Tax=Oceanibium sediminis TaxID=2026339 RepID=UPI001300B556|nr:hypothetical protein [Oceanibium sediminis]